jgi:hypothetical protein
MMGHPVPTAHSPGMSATWQRSERVLWRRSGSVVVLAGPGTDEILFLEGAGALLWELLESPLSIDHLVADAADFYAVDSGDIADEVQAFVGKMEAMGVAIRT